MHRSYRTVLTSACSKALAIFGLPLLVAAILASPAIAQEANEATVPVAHPLHIVPMVTPKGEAISPAATPKLLYYGGPVISNVNVVTVFWTNKVDSQVQTKMPEFYSAITDSTYYDLLSEYATNVTPSGGGTGTNQSIGRGATGGTYTITPSKCAGTSKCTIDDTAIQTELLAQITNGFLPQPELDNKGNVNSLYMVYFPLNVTITMQGSTSCVQFCAYHGTTTGTFNSNNLAYGVFPDMSPSSACFGGCGSDSNYINDTTSVSSHELAESVTDTQVGLAATYAPPLAWYDEVNGEIGDICNAEEATVSAGGSSWVIQKLWSNLLSACVSIGKHPVYQVAAPASATSGSPFNLTITAQNPTTGTMTNYIGTVHFTSSDSAAVLPIDYTFSNADQGKHTFSITLKTSGSQSVTGTDTTNSAITAAAPVTVSGGGTTGALTVTPTSLAFPVTHAGATSATKLVTVTNSNTSAIAISHIGFTGSNPGDFVISSNTCTASIAAKASCKIKVAFAPTAIGARSAALTLTDNASNSPQSVASTGTGSAAVTLTPVKETYAKTTVGVTTAAKVLTFKNLLKTSITISGITLTGANAGDFAISSKTCAGTLAAATSCTIDVTFKPTATGVRNGTLQVSTNAIPSPITAALTGTGK